MYEDKDPEKQRKQMEDSRNRGTFSGKDHIEKSPIGRAVKEGFPLIRK